MCERVRGSGALGLREPRLASYSFNCKLRSACISSRKVLSKVLSGVRVRDLACVKNTFQTTGDMRSTSPAAPSPRLSLSPLPPSLAGWPSTIASKTGLRPSRRRVLVHVLVVAYSLAVIVFLCALLNVHVWGVNGGTGTERAAALGGGRGNAPCPPGSQSPPPPYPPAPRFKLEEAYAIAEEQARAIALEEAPLRQKEEAMRVAKEAERDRRLKERWANATRKHERMEEQRSARRLAVDKARATKLHITLSELRKLDAKQSASGAGGTGARPANVTTMAAPTTAASSSGGGGGGGGGDYWVGSDGGKGGASSLTAAEKVNAQCVDGSSADAWLTKSGKERRALARNLARDKALRGSPSRPLLVHLFLAKGLLDQVRFLWYVVVEAELDGAIAVLPEAALSPADAAGRNSKVESLSTLWDLDTYILLLHCFTGIVAVRPQDVGVSIGYGVPPANVRLDSGELKQLVGASRIITRRTNPTGGTERSMRSMLLSKLTAAAARHTGSDAAANASSGVADGAAGGGNNVALGAALAQLAFSTRLDAQLLQTMRAAAVQGRRPKRARRLPLIPAHTSEHTHTRTALHVARG